MPTAPSTRLLATGPVAADNPDIPADIATLIGQLEARCAGWTSGTAAARPAASVAYARFLHTATDTGAVTYCDGSSWSAPILTLAGGTLTGFLVLHADPAAAMHPATKQYVDALANGLDVKGSARLGTIAALPAYTRVGNVLTANANGALPNIDGAAPAVDDRVLLMNGAAGADNGLFAVTALGDAGTPWILTRTEDANSSAEVTPGMWVIVEAGATLADTGWLLTTNGPIVLNTTALAFTRYPATAPTFVGCQVSIGSAQAIPDSAYTAVSFDTEAFDALGMHSGGAPTRITIPAGKDGVWEFQTHPSFLANVTEVRQTQFKKNGAFIGPQLLVPGNVGAPDVAAGELTFKVALVATDFVEVFVRQNSGGALNLATCDLTATFLGA